MKQRQAKSSVDLYRRTCILSLELKYILLKSFLIIQCINIKQKMLVFFYFQKLIFQKIKFYTKLNCWYNYNYKFKFVKLGLNRISINKLLNYKILINYHEH